MQSERSSLMAISGRFFSVGFVVGIWGAMIPFRFDDLDLSEGLFSIALLTFSVTQLAGLRAAVHLENSFGSRRICEFIMPIFGLMITGLLWAPTLTLFFFCVSVAGTCTGLVEASINGQASLWEERSGKRRMSSFHGFFSLGVGFGGAFVRIGLWQGIDPLWLPFSVPLVVGIWSVLPGIRLINDKDQDRITDKAPLGSGLSAGKGAPLTTSLPISPPRAVWKQRLFWLFGSLMFVGASIEGAVIDWGALYMTNTLLTSSTVGATMIAIFGGAMTIGRFSGDRLVERFGYARVLMIPVLLSGLLLFTAVFLGHVLLALVAFGFFGFAFANTFPLILSEASSGLGLRRFQAIAWMVAFAHTGLFVGPAIFGLIAHFSSLSVTFTTVSIGAFALSLGVWLSSVEIRRAAALTRQLAQQQALEAASVPSDSSS